MFGPDTPTPLDIDSIAHIIQTALTPVFLLSGVASLLNVFASRLARVSDRTHTVAAELDGALPERRRRLEAEIRFLHRRTRILDAAVLLGTGGGGATCAAALLLFVGSLRNSTIAGLLYLAFGCALMFTAAGLLVFMVEVLFASRGLRERQEAAVRRSQARRQAADVRRDAGDGSADGPDDEAAQAPEGAAPV